MNFKQKLDRIIEKNNSLLCVGLDPVLEKLPKHLLKHKNPIFEFNKKIINSTYDLVCSYKPNIAFYEAYGLDGLLQLKKTIEYLKTNHPQIPIVLDAKRSDIGNTARMYAKSIFEYWKADAVTVHPNLGKDSLLPFLEHKDKLTIVLLKTSNPDSGTFQNALVNGKPYYLFVAQTIRKWNFNNIGVFVGATYPKELKKIREIFPESIFLTAGIGAQNANTEQAVKVGIDKNGNNLICNNSREIIYATSNNNFAQASRKNALMLRDTINKYRI